MVDIGQGPSLQHHRLLGRAVEAAVGENHHIAADLDADIFHHAASDQRLGRRRGRRKARGGRLDIVGGVGVGGYLTIREHEAQAIGGRPVDDPVHQTEARRRVCGIEQEQIRAGAPLKDVGAAAALDHVVAGPSAKGLSAGNPDDSVVTGPAG
jgi:hypothetical protein